MKKTKIISVVLLLFIALAACEKQNDTKPVSEKEKLSIVAADTRSGLYHVELLANDTLYQGYNKIFLKITANPDGNPVKSAVVSLHPMMHMTNMEHSAPVENPAGSVSADGYFEGAVVFIMPDNPLEHWTLDVAVDIEGTKDTVHFEIPKVRNLKDGRIVNFISPEDDKTYFISLLQPASPEVGINDIEFTVHYRKNMMSFPPADDLAITFVPEMPSMGHSSPNNEQPDFTANGHYKGKVDFTMTGWWRINVTVKRDNDTLSDKVAFDINF